MKSVENSFISRLLAIVVSVNTLEWKATKMYDLIEKYLLIQYVNQYKLPVFCGSTPLRPITIKSKLDKNSFSKV